MTTVLQADYEAFEGTPFFVGVPADILVSAKSSGRVTDVARGRQGLSTAADKDFLAGIGKPWPGLTRVIDCAEIAVALTDEEKQSGISPGKPHWVCIAKGEGFGEYWRDPQIAIDWSLASVAELERRARLPVGTPGKAAVRNRDFYFRAGLTYTVVSKARLSVRAMPQGWVFSDKGSAIFVEDDQTDSFFLLAYLNSMLATYFMKKLVNTTTTAHLGYIEKLPYRRPDRDTEAGVSSRSREIVATLQADSTADIAALRTEIDELIFDLFEIGASRQHVREFYRTLDRVERPDQAASE